MTLQQAYRILRQYRWPNNTPPVKLHDKDTLRRASAAYKRNQAEPGDCGEDISLLIGLAIAEAEIGVGPGWMPEVQKLGVYLAQILDRHNVGKG
jgi:hypothetical protein